MYEQAVNFGSFTQIMYSKFYFIQYSFTVKRNISTFYGERVILGYSIAVSCAFTANA